MRTSQKYYLTLSLCSIMLFIFTVKKTNHLNRRYLLPLFLALSGINYIFEYFVLVIGKAYKYSPKMFKNSYYDNILGSNISQLFVVPTSSLIISILNLKYRWSLFFTLVISSIEILFKKKKIYRHYWWKIWYTFIGLQFFFFLAKFWRKYLIEMKSKTISILTLFLSVFVTHTTLIFYNISILKTFLFNVNWYKKRYQSSTAFGTIYTFFSSIIIVFSILLDKMYFKILSILLLLSGDLFLIRKNVLTVYRNVYYLLSPITKIVNMLVGIYIYKLLFIEESK